MIPELRGHGTGSEFLQKLKDELPAQNGVFIETECPDAAKTDVEVTLRRRRIHFYLSNGAVLTNTKCLLFGVDYNILYIIYQRNSYTVRYRICIGKSTVHFTVGCANLMYQMKIRVLDANDYLI